MKVVILGDTHFGGGYSLGTSNQHKQINTRLIDYANTFDYVVDYMKNHNIKHFVITGDIFESRRPYASELGLFAEKMNRLSEIGITTHIVIGNHDLVQEQSSTTIDVLKNLKLPTVNIHSDIESIKIDDFNIIFLPFRNRQMLNCSSNEEAIERINTKLIYEKNKLSGPIILVGHFMIDNNDVVSHFATEVESNEIVLPKNMFNGFDGVVMGHIHGHKILRKNPFISYVGSMERNTFGEKDDQKYFLVFNSDDISFQFEELPIRNLFDIRINQSESNVGAEAFENCCNFITQYHRQNNLKGSIIRLTIVLNESAIVDFQTEKIHNLLKKIGVFYCVGIYTELLNTRQLRKSVITEKLSPKQSFLEYLTLIEDDGLRELVKRKGLKIIEGQNDS
jgi:exonuclease SbcD